MQVAIRLEDQEFVVRRAAAEALGLMARHGGARHSEEAVKFLEHQADDVRREAVKAFCAMGEHGAGCAGDVARRL